MSVGIAVDSKALRKALREAPGAIINAIYKSLTRSAVYTQGQFRRNLPVGVSGNLRRNIPWRFYNKLSVSIEPQAKSSGGAEYAPFIEYGTKPHWTSVNNLQAWANLKGINVYALQRSIAFKGTKAQPFLEKTYLAVDKFAQNDMRVTVNSEIEKIL